MASMALREEILEFTGINWLKDFEILVGAICYVMRLIRIACYAIKPLCFSTNLILLALRHYQLFRQIKICNN